MKLIGYALIELESSAIVWKGQMPARIELDSNGTVALRADFDRAGLVVPDAQNPTHKMVERFEIEPPSDTAIRVSDTESFDGEKVIVDPNWIEPEVAE